jgi:hypothetical protein
MKKNIPISLFSMRMKKKDERTTLTSLTTSEKVLLRVKHLTLFLIAQSTDQQSQEKKRSMKR